MKAAEHRKVLKDLRDLGKKHVEPLADKETPPHAGFWGRDRTSHQIKAPVKDKLKLEPIPDRLGDFDLIHKDKLEVDETYQRTRIRWQNVKKGAVNFKWQSFGVISVVKRDDGSYKVMDGQHRVEMAKLRDDVEYLPCYVHEGKGVEVEAKSYLETNVYRSLQSVTERFKAGVAAGEAHAVFADNLFSTFNLYIGEGGGATNRPRSIFCLSSVLKAAERDHYSTAEALRICAYISDRTSRGITRHLFEGFFFLLTNGLVTNANFKKRAFEVNPLDIVDEIDRRMRIEKKGYMELYARSILQIVNKNKQDKHRFTVDALKGEK